MEQPRTLRLVFPRGAGAGRGAPARLAFPPQTKTPLPSPAPSAAPAAPQLRARDESIPAAPASAGRGSTAPHPSPAAPRWDARDRHGPSLRSRRAPRAVLGRSHAPGRDAVTLLSPLLLPFPRLAGPRRPAPARPPPRCEAGA